MDFLPKESYKRILIITFYCLIGGLLLFIFLKYLLKLLLPFIIAWAVSLIIRPLSEILHKRTRLPKKLLKNSELKKRCRIIRTLSMTAKLISSWSPLRMTCICPLSRVPLKKASMFSVKNLWRWRSPRRGRSSVR